MNDLIFKEIINVIVIPITITVVICLVLFWILLRFAKFFMENEEKIVNSKIYYIGGIVLYIVANVAEKTLRIYPRLKTKSNIILCLIDYFILVPILYIIREKVKKIIEEEIKNQKRVIVGILKIMFQIILGAILVSLLLINLTFLMLI